VPLLDKPAAAPKFFNRLSSLDGLGLSKIGSTIHPYPTQAEAIRKLGDQYSRTRFTPLVRGVFDKWLSWSHEEVDTKLKTIMRDIHAKCVRHGQTDEMVNYVRGANIAGFIKVADAMLAYGVV